MKRPAIYSGAARRRSPAASAGRPGGASARPADAAAADSTAGAPLPDATVPPPGRARRLRAFLGRHERATLVTAMFLAAAAALFLHDYWREPATRLTQDDIDRAVLHTLQSKPIPSRAAAVADSVRASVVRVRGYDIDDKGVESERGVGTGVVIVDKGVILTNLHVVEGAKRIDVTFADGSQADADVIAAQYDNDLAVIQAKKVPDDLVPATLGSTQKLRPGDHVVAVGFPFGIGPSVSEGVVSGLNREFQSPEGERLLTRLIQFDAAANPGSSGGPLVTMDGEVVGIVTAILNPTQTRTFIGIGFAVTIESAGAAAGMPPF